MFKAIPLDKEVHFPLMCEWWEGRSFPAPPVEFTPPTGLIVLHHDTPVCGGFLFKSDANMAVIGNLVSDKKVPFEIRTKALDYLIVSLTAAAKKDNFGLVACSTNLPRLMKRFEDLGFILTDEGVSQFGRVF